MLLGSFTSTSHVELAAQLRRAGFEVVLVAPSPRTRGERLQDWINRIVYSRTWHALPPAGTELPDHVVAGVLAHPTVDVHGTDYDGQQLALRGGRLPGGTRSLVVGAEWFDKRHLAVTLEQLGIPGPRWWDDVEGRVPPVVVKSRLTTGGLGVRICRDHDELAAAWRELGGTEGNAFIQELHEGESIATTGVARDGELLAEETYLTVSSPHAPTSPPIAQLMVERPELVENVRILLRATRHTGLFNVQQFVDDEGRGRVFDFNPRGPASWAAIDAAGSTLAEVYLALLAGDPIPATDPLPAGTRGASLQLTQAPPMSGWRDLHEWWSQTGSLMKQRRKTLGWRFFAWSVLMRNRLALRSLKSIARARGSRSVADPGPSRRSQIPPTT